MAIAFFQPRALFPSLVESKVSGKTIGSIPDCDCQDNNVAAIAVFSHHRDVKVALDELNCGGFSHDSLTLVARQARRCNSYSELTTNDSFDARKLGIDPATQKLFSRLFAKGKYLLLVRGSEDDVNAASKIVSRRRKHAEVWRFERV